MKNQKTMLHRVVVLSQRVVVLAPLTLLTSLAAAAGGGGADGHVPLTDLGLHTFNLLLLLGVLFFALRGKVTDALRNRAAGVKRSIDEANRLEREARARFEELEGKLSGFEQELAGMRRDAEVAAEKERASIVGRADDDAERLREAAARTIRDETERARTALRKDAAELAVGVATRRVREQITADDHQRLAGEFLGAVRRDSNGTNGVGNG